MQDSRARERHLLLSVSHDLRTPLTSIRGFAEAIQDGAIEDNAQAADVIKIGFVSTRLVALDQLPVEVRIKTLAGLFGRSKRRVAEQNDQNTNPDREERNCPIHHEEPVAGLVCRPLIIFE